MNRFQKTPHLTVFVEGQQMGGVESFRKSVFGNFQSRNQIEPEKEQVHQIVIAEIFTARVGMDQSQTPEPAAGSPYLTEFWNHQSTVVPDDDMLDLSGSMDEDANLPVELMGELAQASGHLWPNDQITLDPAAANSFKQLQLIFFQPLNISAHPGDVQSSLVCLLSAETGSGQRARAIELSASGRGQTDF